MIWVVDVSVANEKVSGNFECDYTTSFGGTGQRIGCYNGIST